MAFVTQKFMAKGKQSLIVTCTFFVICSYVAFIVDNPPSPDTDLLVYYFSGNEILFGDRENVQIFNAPVGWPILLASFDIIINDVHTTAKIFSIIFSSGIVFLSYWIIQNIFGHKVAFLGQIITAVCPMLHVESIITHNEMLPVFLIFISFYFITKNELSKNHIILCSVFLGLSFMLRPQSLFLAFGFLITILLFIKKQKKSFFVYFLIFFLISICPLVVYNIFTTNNLLDNDPDFYLSYEAQNKEYFQSLDKQENQFSFDTTITNLQNYSENYFENLLLYNPHLFLNLGLGYNNFSIIPFLPFSGIIFVFGGIFGLLQYNLPKKYLFGIIGISISLPILLFITNLLQTYFLSIFICPLLLIGIFSFKKIPNQVLRLLTISLFFLLFISFFKISGSWDLFSILILPVTMSSFFIIKIIPKILIKIQSLLKIKSNLSVNFSLVLIILAIIASSLLTSFMIEKHQMYGVPVDYHNLFSSEKNHELLGLEYKRVGEILSKEPDIENKIVMSNSLDYAYYTKSKFLFTNFKEGLDDDTINMFLTRDNWSSYDVKISNAFSIPPDRNNISNPIPDYLIYKKSVDNIKHLQILENPNDPRIPQNLKLIYENNQNGIFIYKIKN